MAKAKAVAGARWRMALRPRTLLSSALALVAVVLCAGWAWGRFVRRERPAVLAVAPGNVQSIVRRTEIAVADAGAVWRRALPEAARRGYAEREVVFFSRVTGTPCAGGGMVSGPFYCPETGVAAFDLAFMDALGWRLKTGRDLGLALYAVRLSAEHLQRQTGLLDAAALEMIGARRDEARAVRTRLALQADCLTGVWAAGAAPRIGAVPGGFYGQMVWSARNLVADLAREGVRVPAQFDPMAAAAEEERAAAFAAGYAAGRLAACRGARTRLSDAGRPQGAVAVEGLEGAAARGAVGLDRHRLGQAGAVGHEDPGVALVVDRARSRRLAVVDAVVLAGWSDPVAAFVGEGGGGEGHAVPRRCRPPQGFPSIAGASRKLPFLLAAQDLGSAAPVGKGVRCDRRVSVARAAPGERPKSAAAVSWPASMMPRRMARVRVK